MEQPNAAATAPARGVTSLRSLLVEPDTEARLMLELALSIRGQDVTPCADAKSARVALAEGQYGLVVLDRELPDTDALRFCSEIRALPGGAQASILIVSSGPSDEDQTAALAAGADDYIAWPIAADALRRRLDAVERRITGRSDSRRTNGTPGGVAGEPFLIVSADGSIRKAGDAAELLFGFPPEALVGVNAFSFFHVDDAPQLLSLVVESLARPEQTRAIEVRVRRDGDTWRTITVSATNRLNDPDLRGIALHLRGPDAKVHVADQVTRMTMHDRVTDLPNRALFLDRIDHAVARAARRNQPVVVMVVDFNDFTATDGTLHSDVSDGLVVALAQRVRSCLRTSDTAARLGRDEFGLLLEEIVDLTNVSIVANRIVQAMAVPFFDGGAEIELRPNIGVATTTPDRHRAVDLLRDANIARAWARVQGSGKFVMFDPTMKAPDDEPSTDQFEIEELQPAVPQPSPAMVASIDDRLTALNERIASLEQTILKLDRAVSGSHE